MSRHLFSRVKRRLARWRALPSTREPLGGKPLHHATRAWTRRSLLVVVAAMMLAAAPALLHAGFSLKNLDLNKVVETAKKVEKGAKALAPIGPQEERIIGESVALQIIGKYGGLVRDEAITRRVNLMGHALAYYSPRPVLAWRFGVLDSPSVNGFSAPGGFVFITRGLYELCGDDNNALAAVLAHEIAHITGRHALKIIDRTEFVNTAAEFAAERSSDVAQVQAQLSQFDLGIDKVLNTLFEKGFDPQTEFEADKSGRQLAATVGYAPGGLRGVLTQLQQKTPTEAAPVFSTHPPLSERIARLPQDATL